MARASVCCALVRCRVRHRSAYRDDLRKANPIEADGVDPSLGYLAPAREQVRDPRARFYIADARNLPVESGRYDFVVSALVLNFIPELPTAMAEMARATRANGIVVAYVWDDAGKMEMMRYFWDAAVALRPVEIERDEGRRFPI